MKKEKEEMVNKNAVARVVRLLQELIGADEKTTYTLIKKELDSLVKWHIDRVLSQKNAWKKYEGNKTYGEFINDNLDKL